MIPAINIGNSLLFAPMSEKTLFQGSQKVVVAFPVGVVGTTVHEPVGIGSVVFVGVTAGDITTSSVPESEPGVVKDPLFDPYPVFETV
jgi:hypothetical protein